MALTIINDIPPVVGTRSPFWLTVDTDRLTDLEGVALVYSVDVYPSHTYAAGDKVYLKSGFFLIEFTFVDGPTDNSGYQISTNYLGIMSPGIWSSQIVSDLQKNYYINTFYDLSEDSYGGDYARVFFTAKYPGSKYNLLTYRYNAAIGVPISYNVQPFESPATHELGTDPSNKPNFRIYCEVYIESKKGLADYALAGTLAASPINTTDTNGRVIFEISEILDAYLETDLPPISAYSGISLAQTGVKGFYLRLYETWGAVPLPASPITTDVYNALKAGLSFLTASGNDVYTNWIKYQETPNVITKPLTWRDEKTLATKEELSWLYFLAADTALNYKLKKTAYYTDGSSQTLISHTVASAFRYDVIIFPLGYTQLSIGDINPLKTVEYYTVQVLRITGDTINVPSSFPITIYMDPINHVKQRTFIFSNSLGGFDTLVATGLKERKTNIQSNVGSVYSYKGYNQMEGKKQVFHTSKENTVKINIGYKGRQHQQFLDEFALAKRKFEIVNGKLIPIILETKSYKSFDEKEEPNDIEFEYSYAFDDKVFTPYVSPEINLFLPGEVYDKR